MRGVCAVVLVFFAFDNTWFDNEFRNPARGATGNIPNSNSETSQASTWCGTYIGRWMCKTEGSLTGLGENFGRSHG